MKKRFALKVMVFMLMMSIAALPVYGQYMPTDPKEDIINVRVWDETGWYANTYASAMVVDGSNILWVELDTAGDSTDEVQVQCEYCDGEWIEYCDGQSFTLTQTGPHTFTGWDVIPNTYGPVIGIVCYASLQPGTDKAGPYGYVLGDGTSQTPMLYSDQQEYCHYEPGTCQAGECVGWCPPGETCTQIQTGACECMQQSTVPEFSSLAVALVILLTTPAFAYMIAKKKH